jgi:hypothetical protein
MIDPSGHIIVLDQPAFACSGAPLFDFCPEPLVVVHRRGQQVERHLVDSAARLRGQSRQLRIEFGRNLQVHKASVGAIPGPVNVRPGIDHLGAFVLAASLTMIGTSKLQAPTADGPSADCDRPLASFGLTDRQARFLVTVMRHSGVFVGRQYATFAGITHGQKVHDFIERLLVRRFARSIELGTTGRTRIFHVHYKPLYAAIGEPDNRNRRRVAIDQTIQRLMILDAVLADRSVTWLGSEREKRRYFKERLGDNLRDNEFPRLVFGKPPDVTIRYFPDKLPIGYEPDRRRHVFLYLARSPSPMDFRVFILRHLELLNALGLWTIRVLFPKSMGHARDAYSNAAHELLATPLTLSQRDELESFFRQPDAPSPETSADELSRWRATRRAFRSARFAALRRYWIAEGSRSIYLATSPISRDAMARGRRRVECVTMPHNYAHLLALGRHGLRRMGTTRGDEARGSTVPLAPQIQAIRIERSLLIMLTEAKPQRFMALHVIPRARRAAFFAARRGSADVSMQEGGA